MRANHKHYRSDEIKKTKAVKKDKSTDKSVVSGKGFKVGSVIISIAVAAAALIVPTTTLAPDVDAYEDSRAAAFAVGNLDRFSGVITNNCAEVTTAPVTEEADEEETEAVEEETEVVEEETEAVEEETEEATEPATEAVEEEDEEEETEPATEAEEEEATEPEEKEEDEEESEKAEALTDAAAYDPNYSPSYVDVDEGERDLLERIVMGEAGSLGYTCCALVAQAIRDTMNYTGITSVAQIIDEYQYEGDTDIQPNADVKNAVAFIFDENGSAVQHRVMYFYTGESEWHETQNFVTEVNGERFFDIAE